MANIIVDINNSSQNIYQYTTGIYSRSTTMKVMSLSKPVTGAVIMTLVDSGLININDKVGKYISSWNANGKQDVTIKHIMSHRSGINAEGIYDGPGLTLQQVVDKIATETTLKYPSGTQVEYQSASYQVVARVAEIVTGQSWKNLFNARIRNKCGMGNAAYNPWEGFPENPLAGYGLECTHGEYMNFLKMMMNKGLYNGVRVLNESSVLLMESDMSDGLDVSKGFGLIRNEIVNGVCKEPTGESAAGCYAWYNRDKNYYACLFTQAGYSSTINSNIGFRVLVRMTIPNQLGLGEGYKAFTHIKSKPSHMNIRITGGDKDWRIFDDATYTLSSGYEWFYRIGDVTVQTGTPLNNYKYQSNNPLTIFKFQAKIGLDTLNRFDPAQPSGGYYDPLAVKALNPNTTAAFSSHYFTKYA